MRVLMVLVALVATPFIAGVAQQNSGHGYAYGRSEARGHRHADARSKSAKSAKAEKEQDCDQQGQHEGNDEGCGSAPVLGSISGTVFFDLDQNGARGDPLVEYGIQDWPIMLSGPVTSFVMSDASGHYAFPNLTPGNYQVCEAQRYAWLQTAPGVDACPAGGYGYNIALGAAQVLGAQDFGNVR